MSTHIRQRSTTQSSGPTVTMEIWSDIACPWCYIGKAKLTTALRQFPQRDQVEVRWRAYQLNPAQPVGTRAAEVDALARMKGMPREQVTRMFDQVRVAAQAEGLPIDFQRTVSANTFDAHRLTHLASGDLALQERLLDALYRAHFVDGQVIDERDVLVEVARSCGMDGEGVRTALESDAAAGSVREDLATARSLGVSGVPFFVANRSIAVSGAQPVEVLTQLLTRAHEDAGEVSASGWT